MPIFRTAQIAFCLLTQASLLASDSLNDWFSSPMLQEPLRLEQLSGDKIVEMSKSSFSRPLIYPKSVSVFERMDASLPRFYTLNELASNPGLRPIHQFHSNSMVAQPELSIRRPAKLNVSEREKQLFDTSLLLVPKNSVPLPSDDQLQAFLDAGRHKYTTPVNSKEIIDNLLKDEYANHPVISLLNDSPEVQKVLRSESFNQSTDGLFSSANIALAKPPSHSGGQMYRESLPTPPSSHEEETVRQQVDPNAPTFLKLKARKQARDGTLKPAQASEIYLTTQDLKELLKDISSDPAVAGEVRSVAELWAKAEKDGSNNPEVALGVKAILLSAKIGRARTDPYGQASLENISPDDKYFVIGIDKDVDTDVVTIWSKEVAVAPGENLVELTSTDIIYQE